MKTNQELVKEIHTEFDTSAERMLDEALEIIKVGYSQEKEDRLAKLGFARSKQAVAADKAAELKERITHYKQAYPAHKFVTEEVVKQICEKYNLLLGGVSSFIGEVPEKNLVEMEAFKVKKDDYEKSNGWVWEDLLSRSWFNSSDPFESTFKPRRAGGRSDRMMAYEMAFAAEYRKKENEQFETKPEFKICAPETDFNTVGQKKEGHKLVPEDPIVLCPVKGGYLVVTKWGLEASDSSVIDERLN